MSDIKNVTVVGASGRLGSFILDKLVASKRFNVQVVKRLGSSSTFSGEIKVVEADYEDVEALKAAFQGQDAVVSVVGSAGILSQKAMVDAAIAADVKRFLPSNFGSNMTNPHSRKLPVFEDKVVVEDYLIEKSKSTELTYSFVYNGGFTDFLIQYNVLIDLSNYTPTLFNGGMTDFSSTSMPTAGDAVVGVLSHPEQTRNRPVYVSESIFSQKQLLDLAKELAPSRPWAPVDVDLDVVVKKAMDRLAQGQHDLGTLMPIITKSILDPKCGGKFTENDNELLGIKAKDQNYWKELISPLVK